MDEFLALMEADGPSPNPTSHEATDDEDASISATPNATSSLPSPPSYSRRSDTTTPKPVSVSSSHDTRSPTPRGESCNKPTASGVDEKLGIRMINRNMSSLDLLDLITTTSPYYSPAQISAMSLQALCRVLVDPPSIVDRATVQGRTELVTVGIVFQNSGTKTSSRGGAFCILTIGSNLQTGPCVSIFLFGSAYTKFCRSCQAGQVVAISNPKLLPARDDDTGKSDTSISLSVHDQSQVVHVAKARDYGICKASVRGKQPDGTWKNNGATCKKYVDTRVSDYCELHRNHGKKANHLANCSQMRGVGELKTNSLKRGANLIHQLKTQKVQTVAARLTMNQNRFLGKVPVTGASNSVAATQHQSLAFCAPPKKGIGNPYLDKRSAQNVATVRHLNTGNPRSPPVTMSMKRQNPGLAKLTSRTTTTNRFMGAPSPKTVTPSSNSFKPKGQEKSVAENDWLQEAVASKRVQSKSLTSYVSNPSGNRTRKVSTIGGGFDGSVAIPKPSRLFSAPTPAFTRTTDHSNEGANALEVENMKAEVKKRQAALAERLRERKADRQTMEPRGKGGAKQSSSRNSFLDSIRIDNIEEIINAKSQFANEVDAEEYAKNRSRVVELEKLEGKEIKRKAASKEKENQKIQVEWICQTCPSRPCFRKYPFQCAATGHTIKQRRLIKEGTTKSDERTQLNEKGSEKGGLTLGRGLEWSRNRFSG